ncbi:uncharacterized protein LOC126844475 isoform X2 [Adelges cooleyi]|uniref:uncharacterized protein LOC126844475 isoform X2 n=1 Tax=Adelges cooleyi TaxID=133065 RepID=UPI0021804398|nr:uncharacterized protein LOC126844475 isoform X2 [Adelges cooleyi]
MTAADDNGTPRRRRLVVDTLSVDCTEFSGAFLTCPTCLCVYDADEHAPKLLSCTHTVCTHCAGRMAAASKARMPPIPVTEVAEDDGGSEGNTIAEDRDRVQLQEQASFKCPICRQRVMVPSDADGGVQALPPSFLVNQLLDLVCAPPVGMVSGGVSGALSSKRTTVVVPTCAGGAGTDPGHTERELAYCSRCDHTYCPVCVEAEEEDNDHNEKDIGGIIPVDDTDTEPVPRQQCHHPTSAVLPASVAAARWADVLQYRAAELANKLDRCARAVQAELQALDDSQRRCKEAVDSVFGAAGLLVMAIENRRLELISEADKTCLSRRTALDHQLKEILSETAQITATGRCSTILDPDLTTVEDLLEYGSEVQSVRKAATEMGRKLTEVSNSTMEPAANGHVRVRGLNTAEVKAAKQSIHHAIHKLGIIRATETCPSQCWFEYCSTESGILPSSPSGGPLMVAKSVGTVLCRLIARDALGCRRRHGGDPVDAEWWPVVDDNGKGATRSKGGGRYAVNADDSDSDGDNNVDFNEDGVRVIDHGDGYYTVRVLIHRTGRYRLRVRVLGRQIRPTTTVNGHHGCIEFRVVDNEATAQCVVPSNNESDSSKARQPAAVTAVCHKQLLQAFVLDLVAGQVCILKLNGKLIELPMTHCDPLLFRGRSATGLAAVLCSLGTTLLACNWRTGVVCRTLVALDSCQGKAPSLEWVRVLGVEEVLEPVCVAAFTIDHLDGLVLLLLGDSRGRVHGYRITRNEELAEHVYTIDNGGSGTDDGVAVGGSFIAVVERELYIIPSGKGPLLNENNDQKISCRRRLDVYNVTDGKFKRTLYAKSRDDNIVDLSSDIEDDNRHTLNKQSSASAVSRYCVVTTCPGLICDRHYVLACRKHKRRGGGGPVGVGGRYVIDVIDTLDDKVVNTVKCSLKRRPLSLAAYRVACSVPLPTTLSNNNDCGDGNTLQEQKSNCTDGSKENYQSEGPIYYEYYVLVADGTVVNRYRFR